MERGHIHAQTSEGPVDAYKATAPVDIPNIQFVGDTILVMIADDEEQGKFTP